MMCKIDFGCPNLFWPATAPSARTVAVAHKSTILREIEFMFADAPSVEFYLNEVLKPESPSTTAPRISRRRRSEQSHSITPVKYARTHKTRPLIDFDRSDDSRV